jgi:Uma2 family endonuclease
MNSKASKAHYKSVQVRVSHNSLQLAELYQQRWQATEVNLRHLKTTLNMEMIRAKTPEMVQKDIQMHLLAYNLLRTVMWQSAQHRSIEPLRVSLQGTRQLFDQFHPLLVQADDAHRHHLYLTLLSVIAQQQMPFRPHRVEPRVVKRRPKPFPRMQQPRSVLKTKLLAIRPSSTISVVRSRANLKCQKIHLFTPLSKHLYYTRFNLISRLLKSEQIHCRGLITMTSIHPNLNPTLPSEPVPGFTAERPFQMPPTQADLPYDDDEKMETQRHKLQMELLIDGLLPWLEAREDGYVGGNMFVYYSLEQVKNKGYKGPDVFVALDVPKGERLSWVSWEEGKPPDVVIELLSDSTATFDKTKKKQIYQNQMRVPAFYWFDPFNPQDWAGFHLQSGQYQPIQPNDQGHLACHVLDLTLAQWQGSFKQVEATWLRWASPNGDILLTAEEQAHQQAEQAHQQAEQAYQQAEQAHQQAEQAHQRATQAEAQVQQIARNLLQAGMSIAQVAETTGLSLETLQTLS